MKTIYSFLKRINSWWVFFLLLIGFFLCQQGFRWRSQWLTRVEIAAKPASSENHERSPNSSVRPRLEKAPDAVLWKTATELEAFFVAIGPETSRRYAFSEISLDVAFPLIYGTLISLLICKTWPEPIAIRLIALPLAAIVFDLSENILHASRGFTGNLPDPLLWICCVLTSLKFLLILLSVLAFLIPVARLPFGSTGKRAKSGKSEKAEGQSGILSLWRRLPACERFWDTSSIPATDCGWPKLYVTL